jgi:hypothetical protein
MILAKACDSSLVARGHEDSSTSTVTERAPDRLELPAEYSAGVGSVRVGGNDSVQQHHAGALPRGTDCSTS